MRKIKIGIIFLIAITSIVVLALHKPIAQNIAYHNFADGRTMFGIPNFWNVISNLPYSIIGIMGLVFLFQKKSHVNFIETKERYFYWAFFIGVFLIGFGSSYYHLNPDNTTLIWDRLPMTIAFMAFFAAIIGERINVKAGVYLLLPLLIFGIATIVYWHISMLGGFEDLRPYAWVQAFPILSAPLMLLMFKPRYTHNYYIWLTLLLYVIAKTCESYDVNIFNYLGHTLSGHTIKHFVSAAATYTIYRYIRDRKPIAP